MSKNNIRISKNEFTRAQSVCRAVGPAAQAMAAVDAGVLGLSAKDAKTVADAAAILTKAAVGAQSIIDAGNAQFEARNTDLLNKASTRLFRIFDEIELAIATQRLAKQAHLEKANEMRKQGFSQVEIDAVLTDPAPEIAALEQKVADLGEERLRVEAFLGDAPRFDPAYLLGTSIEVVADQSAEAA